MATSPPVSAIWPSPGWTITITPANPASTAPQRQMPVFSRSRTAASRVEKIGTEKPIAVASAMGSKAKAAKLSPMATRPMPIRTTWLPARLVLSDAIPGPSATNASAASVVPSWR